MRKILSNFSILIKIAKFFYNFFALKEVKTEKERKVFTNIWYKIWLEEGYARDESVLEKKKIYEKVSQDFLIKFLFFPIGTVRIIHNNEEVGLPILNNFKINKNFVKEKIVEISLFTIKKHCRFSHLSNLILLKKLYKFLKQNNIPGFLAAIDQKLYYFLVEKLKIPFQKIGEEKIYEGSLTYPVYLNLKEGEEYLKKNNYQFYKFFVL